jgi:hypothetical protein
MAPSLGHLRPEFRQLRRSEPLRGDRIDGVHHGLEHGRGIFQNIRSADTVRAAKSGPKPARSVFNPLWLRPARTP